MYSMYFLSRTEAGKELAKQLEHYRFENSVVLSLSDGGVVVGAQIAAVIHCPLTMLLTEDIVLPGELSAVGVVDQNGGFTYNDYFSTGELDELKGEYHSTIEQQKMEKLHSLNRILTDGGLAEPEILKDRTIIIVSDGLVGGLSLLAAINFLKPIRTKRIVVAVPLASVESVDKMHVLADELHVLSVIDSTFKLDHYYEKNDVPERESILQLLDEAILHWR